MRESVLYELQMLFGTAQVLRDEVQGPTQGMLPWPLKMATIESFAIHARALEAFLWGRPSDRFLVAELVELGALDPLANRIPDAVVEEVDRERVIDAPAMR